MRGQIHQRHSGRIQRLRRRRKRTKRHSHGPPLPQERGMERQRDDWRKKKKCGCCLRLRLHLLLRLRLHRLLPALCRRRRSHPHRPTTGKK